MTAAEAVITLPRWRDVWTQLGTKRVDDNTLADLHSAVLERYCEPHRHYHSRQHLIECLALFDSLRTVAAHPAEVEIALWFHDAIYDVHAHDNEQRSADWAAESMRNAGGIDESIIDRVHALILATCHRAVPAPGDASLLVDIDLAILGAEARRFAEYEQQIRAEYVFVPEAVFTVKRREVMRGFANRPRIYGTAECYSRFEAVARKNLAIFQH